jgi:methionine salvage enolase-phosphatase E1
LDAAALESRMGDIERRLSKLEEILQEERQSQTTISKELEQRLVENADKMNTQEMIIISLRVNGKQTKEEIKKMLQDWGKVYGNWFDGGNFNGRLVRKNIVKKEGKNDKNEDLFSLTKRGEMLADELIIKVTVG